MTGPDRDQHRAFFRRQAMLATKRREEQTDTWRKRRSADRIAAESTDHRVNRIENEQAPEVSGGLDPLFRQMTKAEATHLLRRTSFGAAPSRVGTLTGQIGATAANALVDDATAIATSYAPAWRTIGPPAWDPNKTPAENDAIQAPYWENNNEWGRELVQEGLFSHVEEGLRAKMSLFWHNHFVTQWSTYSLSSFAYRYWALLRKHALGDFKAFVSEMGLEPSMLIFLNGDGNIKDAPNENYARELLELFTMGPIDKNGSPNYTESDVKELSRALTGYWVHWNNMTVEFSNWDFDGSEKTILGKSGAFDYQAAIDVIFEQRAEEIAWFVCEKLYREFVYRIPNRQIVEEMAATFLKHDFNMEPVVRQLLASEHFFERQFIGARLKSPIEMYSSMLLENEAWDRSKWQYTHMHWQAGELGQYYLDPPNVFGWPGARHWMSTSSLPARQEFSSWFVYGGDIYDNNGNLTGRYPAFDLLGLARRLTDPSAADVVFHVAIKLAENLFPVPLEEMDIPHVSGPFAGDLVGNPLPDWVANGPEYVRDLAKTLLGNTPWYDWTPYEPDFNWAALEYLIWLQKQPEFHLI